MNLRTHRRYTGPSAATLLLLEDRSRGRCELCGEAAVHTHHRRPRGMGSSRDEATNAPSNLLRLCAACHTNVESRRAEAFGFGWLVSQYMDPGDVAVLVGRGSRWVHLSDAGSYEDAPAVAL